MEPPAASRKVPLELIRKLLKLVLIFLLELYAGPFGENAAEAPMPLAFSWRGRVGYDSSLGVVVPPTAHPLWLLRRLEVKERPSDGRRLSMHPTYDGKQDLHFGALTV